MNGMTRMVKVNSVNYYTIFGASEQLSVSESTTRRWIRMRKLRSLKHPKGLLILPAWIGECLEKMTTTPKKA